MDCMFLKLKGMYKIFFLCVYNFFILVCGKILIFFEGIIISSEYFNLYFFNVNCKWNFLILENSFIFVYVVMEIVVLVFNYILRF